MMENRWARGGAAALLLIWAGLFFASGETQAAQTNQPANQEQILAELRKSIAGRESQPAEQVWKNIQQFKGLPAGRLLTIMNAYTRALGVACTHCHVAGEWEKEEVKAKQVARDMGRMTQAINDDFIKKIPNLTANVGVNCSTCHRGQPKPDSTLPPPKS